MFTAMLVTAISVMVLMMVAAGIRIIVQDITRKCFSSLVSRAMYSGIELDPGLSKCLLSSHPYTSADQSLNLGILQESGKCAVPASQGLNDLLTYQLIAIVIVDLKQFSVSEMLEYLSVIISYCYSNILSSFPSLINISNDLCAPIIIYFL